MGCVNGTFGHHCVIKSGVDSAITVVGDTI